MKTMEDPSKCEGRWETSLDKSCPICGASKNEACGKINSVKTEQPVEKKPDQP